MTSPYNAPGVTIAEMTGPAMNFNLPKAGLYVSDSEYLSLAGKISLEFLIRDNGSAAGQTIVSKGGLAFTLAASNTPQISADFTETDLAVTGDWLWNTDVWQSVAITWDGEPTTADGVRFYIDGGQHAPGTATATGTQIPDHGFPLILGNIDSPISNTTRILADLDEIRISNVTRSPDWMRASFMTQDGQGIEFLEVTP